ncbi:hypothetical protein PHJA_001811000 [Phtheirospermum japonicum]|uniref:Uncharacterized protein n=1 Tax=Phtheirospermum japonicum TaxID=374723 RepID=A0A830CBX5_9LAMI|nr:hypothetical protein PHJA_001811000 [Phtheirospermum japonicum]
MSSESKALAWVANLSHQFNNFCSEADAIIPQEPIEYLRNRFVTAGESLKQFCSEIFEDALSVGCLDARGPTSPRKDEEITHLPSCKLSKTTPLPAEPMGKIYEDLSSKVAVVKNPEIETSEPSKNSVQCSWVIEYPEEIANFEEDHFAPKVDENKLQNDEVSQATSSTSPCSMEAIQTCVSSLSELIDTGESKELVSSDDDFCSEADNVSYQKTETLDQITNNGLRKIASQDFDDEETEAKGWEKLDRDPCDSDWEII